MANLVCRRFCLKDDTNCNRACRRFRETFAKGYRIDDLDRRLIFATRACQTACGNHNLECTLMCIRFNALVRKYLRPS